MSVEKYISSAKSSTKDSSVAGSDACAADVLCLRTSDCAMSLLRNV